MLRAGSTDGDDADGGHGSGGSWVVRRTMMCSGDLGLSRVSALYWKRQLVRSSCWLVLPVPRDRHTGRDKTHEGQGDSGDRGEPTSEDESEFFGYEAVSDLDAFKGHSVIILANRFDAVLAEVEEKVYARVLYKRD